MADELYFDITNEYFVQSVDSPNQIKGPTWYADDVRPILLKLVKRDSPSSVSVVDLTGVTVQIAIGSPAAVPTVYTSATSSVADGNGFLPISLPLNVAAVQTALGSLGEINPTLEIRVVSSSTPNRYQTRCTLRQRLITGTLADPAAPLIATTLQEVMALCVPRNGALAGQLCSSFIMVDDNDNTKVYRGVLRDGEMHWEQIS
jgi:hypothetical protein